MKPLTTPATTHWFYALGLMWSPFDTIASKQLEYFWQTQTTGCIQVPEIGDGPTLADSTNGYICYRGHRIRIERRLL